MNYQLHYDRLIEKYGSWEKPIGIYTERHRKLPGCMGGTYVKGNAFYMTAEAHFVAHQLLVKMHPKNYDLAFAAWGMTASPLGRRSNNKLFGWLKRRHAKAVGDRLRGGVLTKDHRAKITASLTGENNHRFGISMSDVTKELIAVTKRGSTASSETRSKMIISQRINSAKTSENLKEMWKDVKPRKCPHCGLSGRGPTMLRWHFNNCKDKLP